jgi:hypothetical protein
MDLFDGPIVLVLAGGAAALWLLYRKSNTATSESRTYRRARDGGFRDTGRRPLADPALGAALQAEHDRLSKARDARIAQASSDD